MPGSHLILPSNQSIAGTFSCCNGNTVSISVVCDGQCDCAGNCDDEDVCQGTIEECPLSTAAIVGIVITVVIVVSSIPLTKHDSHFHLTIVDGAGCSKIHPPTPH